MEVMISVNPPYSMMIFSGYKPYEFRNRVLKGMDTGYPTESIKAYIYETKNKGGSGKIIGEVTVSGSYSLHYGDKKYSDVTFVKERFAFIKQLYLYWCNLNGVKPNINEGWFKSKKFRAYQKEIGFFDCNDTLSCNYALILDEPVLYENLISLTEFSNSKEILLDRPPQNMCHVIYTAPPDTFSKNGMSFSAKRAAIRSFLNYAEDEIVILDSEGDFIGGKNEQS